MPLHAVSEQEMFVFYPEKFASEVANNSEIFDYSDWVKDGYDLKIGWQKRDSGLTAEYPQSLEDSSNEPSVGFSCGSGDCLLFSGSHYHQTRPLVADQTRFSLDFRMVHCDDLKSGLAAPNVDNRSRGNAAADYIQL